LVELVGYFIFAFFSLLEVVRIRVRAEERVSVVRGVVIL